MPPERKIQSPTKLTKRIIVSSPVGFMYQSLLPSNRCVTTHPPKSFGPICEPMPGGINLKTLSKSRLPHQTPKTLNAKLTDSILQTQRMQQHSLVNVMELADSHPHIN
jgi:hypothetical protein